MKVIIAGSRTLTDYAFVKFAVELAKFDITEIVSGGAAGIDLLGEKYAKENGIKLTVFIPEWETFGKSAGFMRNEEMGDYAEALIAIWDGESRGTLHMINYMKKLNKPVFVCNLTETIE